MKAAEGAETHVFCINTGRAGSEYLSRLLAGPMPVQSFHEPEPTMSGPFLRMVESQPLTDTFTARLVKVEAIDSFCATTGCRLYCESNHMFIKTFFDVVCARLRDVRVVHLRRPLSQTLRSFVELAYFTSRNPAWPHWMACPFAKTAAMGYPHWDLDSIDMAIAYLIDIEARADRFKAAYPQVPVFETTLALLNLPPVVEDLLDFIDYPLPAADNLARVGLRVNDRLARKRQFGVSADSVMLGKRIDAFLSRLTEAGIDVPHGLML
jgi:hypothetical protein